MIHSSPPRRLISSCAAFAVPLLLPLAAFAAPRYSHTATLLSNGNLLITGGIDLSGNPTASAELLATGSSLGASSDILVGNMSVARSSHTATFLPNGMVLIAGGAQGAAGNPTATTEIYNPATQSFSAGPSMSTARYNHTATLLQDGRVLICGGEDNAGNAIASCDAYLYATNTMHGNIATLNQARAMHTAVLLKDGSVWLAGGWNPSAGNAGTNFFLPTTERFNPVTNTIASDIYLLEARANHSATVMGDGRVLIAGGYNGADYGNPLDPTDPLHNYGILDATEIFDPTVDEISPGPTAIFRRMLHSATLLADGTLNLYGGIGNVGPQQTVVSLQVNIGTMSTTQGGSNAFTLANTNPLTPAIQLTLPVAASGTITSGYIAFVGSTDKPNAVMNISSGVISLTSLSTVSINGATVGCNAGVCGILNLPASLKVTATTLGYVENPGSDPTSATVNLANFNGTFQSSATIVIERMALATFETYNEAKGVTTISSKSNSAVATAQQTATLTTSGDIAIVGGQFEGVAVNDGGLRSDNYIVLDGGDFAAVPATMSSGRGYHTATLLTDGTILVAGGESAPSSPLATAQIYSPSLGTFAPTAGNMTSSRSNHTATMLTNGRVLLAGGYTNQSSTQPTNAAEIYYPNTQLFIPTAPLSAARANHTATLMPDGSVIVFGGQTTAGTYLNSVEQYRPLTANWQTLAAAPAALANQTATLLQDGRILVIGGKTSGGPSSAVYAYTPASNTWATLAPLNVGFGNIALYGHTATLMFDGRVLVVGGDNGLGASKATYLYDPKLNTWAFTGSLTQGRTEHTATLLPNDTVMVSGGLGNPVPTGVEVYHIDGSTWSPSGTFPAARAAHTMTLGLDGKVYAIGGYAGSSFYNSALSGDFSAPPDAATTGAPPSLRQSSITAISPSPFAPGASFNATGTGFEGGTEATGGGSGSMSSSFSYPHLVLQQFGASGGSSSQSDAGFAVDLTTQIYLNAGNAATLNTSLTVPTPTSPRMPYGWYVARTGANDVYSQGLVFQVGPPLPSAAPATISGAALGTSSISWTWGAVAGGYNYDVYQASSAVFIGTSPVNSFLQGGLQPNTTGSIQVAAYSLSGDGPLIVSSTYYTLAAAPTSLSVSSVAPNSVFLQWNPNNNAAGAVYEVSQSSDGFVTSFSTPVPASLQLTSTGTAVNVLQAGTTYYFRVRAFNGAGLPSGFSPTVSAQTTTGVAGVTGVALTQSSIQWSWTPTPGAASYDVFVGSTGLLLGTSSVASFTDSGLGIDTARSILVGAVSGGVVGPLTPSATVYTLANAPGPVTPYYQVLSTGGYTVNWTNNLNPPGITYDVVVYAYNPGSAVAITTYTSTTIGFAVTGLSPATPSSVNVYAVNGNGVLSAPYVIGSTYTLANSPANLVVTGDTSNSITVGWSDNSNSTSTLYQVTYSTDNFVTNIATAVAFAQGANLSTATVTGLLTGTTYWITVQAANPFGQPSSFSNTVTTTTYNGGAPAGLLQGVLSASTTSQIIGTLAGGQFVELMGPAGSVATDATVLISTYAVPGPLCHGAVNIGVAISASPTLLPLRALSLSLGYTSSELGALLSNQAAIMRYVPGSGACLPLNTTANSLNNTLTAEINDFGIFVVALPQTFTSADSARAYPNPFHVNRDGYLTIDQIPAGSRVRIMDLRGDTVLDQEANSAGLVTWSATNGAGRGVASGLYLVIVEGGGAKRIMKLAVIR